jgi:hypothetical protein
MELNSLFVQGDIFPGLKVGQTKKEIEFVLGSALGDPDIITPDVTYYVYETKAGVNLVIVFDKNDVCFEIRIDLDKNANAGFVVTLYNASQSINSSIHFDMVIDILRQLNIEWQFDTKKTYLQTVCILLKSGVRLYYAFGEKEANDYGFFSIKSVLEGHLLA